MSEMAEGMRELRRATLARRAERAVVNTSQLAVLGVAAEEVQLNVYRVQTTRGAVMYYPSSNKWQHKGRVMRGDVQSFAQWIKHFIKNNPEQL